MSGNDDADDAADRFQTRAIHAGQAPDSETGALMTPIFANSTYVQDGPGDHRGYEYSRTATRRARIWKPTSRAWKAASTGARSPPEWPRSTPC